MTTLTLQDAIAKLQPEIANFTPRERLQYQLAQIDVAISAVLSGAQSYSIAGQSITRADLLALQRLKQQLITTLSGGGIRFGTFSFGKSNQRRF